jgi:hypothetical protein
MSKTFIPGSYEPDPDDAETAEMINDAEKYSNTRDEQIKMHPSSSSSEQIVNDPEARTGIYYGCDRWPETSAISLDTLRRARACIPIGHTALQRGF